jgi:putative sigma-54 modulation protein
MTFPFDVKNGFDRSDTLDAHVARRVGAALDLYANHIQHVELRLMDVNGPRHGAVDKVASIGITMRPSGHVVARAGSDDIYDSVTRAARRARSAVSRYVKRLEQRGRQARALPSSQGLDAG